MGRVMIRGAEYTTKGKRRDCEKCAKPFPLQSHFIKAADDRELTKSENTNICLGECLMKVRKPLKV